MDMRPQRLVVVASILMDVTVWVQCWPDRGGDALAREGRMVPGGAFNVIAAASRLQLETAYGGLIGTGVFGAKVREALRELGVPALLDPPRRDRGDTGFDIAVVEADGERTFITAPGAEAHWDQADVARLPFRSGDCVYLSGYDLAYQDSGPTLEILPSRLPKDAYLVLDPGPLVADIPADRLQKILDRVTLLSLNRREATLLTHKSDPAEALAALVRRLPAGCLVVLRLGPDGALVGRNGEPSCRVPARPTVARDTTGAGDVHTGALLARLAAGRSLPDAVRDANAAASWSVERAGPSQSPSLAELDQVLTEWR